MKSIGHSLIHLAADEGKAAAYRVAEDWINTLESMVEVSAPDEVKHINVLLDSIKFGVKEIQGPKRPIPKKRREPR